MSSKDHALQPPTPPKPALIQDTYPAYEMEWEKLKAFLERRFPGTPFQEQKSVCFPLFEAVI